MMDVPRLFGLLVTLWSVFWQPGPAVQQTPNACVGFAWAAWLATAPGPIRHFDGTVLYQLGLQPGRDPQLNYVGDVLLAHQVITRQTYTQDWPTARAWLTRGPLLVAGRWPGGTYLHAWTIFARDTRGRYYYQDSLPPFTGYFTAAQLAGLWFGTATKGP